jgi:serine/threonine-protein kinase HipA
MFNTKKPISIDEEALLLDGRRLPARLTSAEVAVVLGFHEHDIALILGWLIRATDAHAKNFSVLIAAGAQVRLAPLYDISSALPYPKQVDLRRANLAMKIGGTYRLREIGKRDWEKLAVENKISPKMVHDRIERLMDVMPQKCSAVAETLAREGITHPIYWRACEQMPGRIRSRWNQPLTRIP